MLAGFLENKEVKQMFIFDPTTALPVDDANLSLSYARCALMFYFNPILINFAQPVICHPSLECTSADSPMICALVACFLANATSEIVFGDFKLIQAVSNKVSLPTQLASFITVVQTAGWMSSTRNQM